MNAKVIVPVQPTNPMKSLCNPILSFYAILRKVHFGEALSRVRYAFAFQSSNMHTQIYQ